MKVYAVFQEAAYRHECGGIFSTEEKAREVADSLAANDRDSHHSYDVVPFDLDVATPQNKGFIGGEPDVIYSARKPRPVLP